MPLGGGSVGVFGSTLLFYRGSGMQDSAEISEIDQLFPIEEELWPQVAASLRLTAQQRRVVELLLTGKRDKQIASELGIAFATVRTHLDRIFARVGVADRVELILKVFATARVVRAGAACRQVCVSNPVDPKMPARQCSAGP